MQKYVLFYVDIDVSSTVNFVCSKNTAEESGVSMIDKNARSADSRLFSRPSHTGM